LSCKHKAHTVIRTGGPQALHHVVTDQGANHVFSQFGSGTLRGSATHLSRHMLIDPHAILGEGTALMYGSGIRGVFDMMTIHEDALVITPFQAIAGRVRELLRGKARRGSVGIGVGETILDAEVLKEGSIRARDLNTPSLRKKLEAIQAHKWQEFESYTDRTSDIDPAVRDRVSSELAQMEDADTVQWAVERFAELTERVRIVDTDYVAKNILGTGGTVVFEGSQGVLLDRFHGFHPYTTQVRTTPASAHEIMRECGYDGDVQSLGILRAYHTRHGGGPFVTESSDLTDALPDEMNKAHPWQGNFRVGSFDLVAARYALEACGAGAIDGIIITCLDRILARGSWELTEAYHVPPMAQDDLERLFWTYQERIVGIKAASGMIGTEHLKHQEQVTQALLRCSPDQRAFALPKDKALRYLIDLCVTGLQKVSQIPVVAVSVGQTEQDKIEI
ncbi:adenylosuccinate synthetase, partial [Candidatus Kaiserbacteria bacterium]|nr:adenylosuccinate synthetase [Candidatus Kaiserbacteria bacterium]